MNAATDPPHLIPMTNYHPKQVLTNAQTLLAAIDDSLKTEDGAERRFLSGLLGPAKLIPAWDARTHDLRLSYQSAFGTVATNPYLTPFG